MLEIGELFGGALLAGFEGALEHAVRAGLGIELTLEPIALVTQLVAQLAFALELRRQHRQLPVKGIELPLLFLGGGVESLLE